MSSTAPRITDPFFSDNCFVFSIAGYNHLEVAEYLLEHGADVNAQDKGGLIPLHNASSYGVRMLYYLGILLWGENAVLP